MRPRHRLLLRIYLVGVAQILLVALSFWLVTSLLRRRDNWDRDYNFLRRANRVVSACTLVMDRDDELQHALSYAHDLGLDATLYGSDSRVRGYAGPAAQPPLEAAELAKLGISGAFVIHRRELGPRAAIPIRRAGAVSGYALVQFGPRPLPPRPPNLLFLIALGLGGVALVSVVFARSLARPLARLTDAARAFGSGDLAARANLRRSDEVGEVARTFDEMAERVNALLVSQREFLANVSHELRTPLARIRVALDIAAEGDIDAARQSLKDIAEDWGDLERLVEDVLIVARLDLAHAQARSKLLRFEVVDPRALVERVAERFQSLHPDHVLAVDCAAEPAKISADPSLLRRVLDNLLQNAGKYSDPGTTIRLELRADPSTIQFAVADHGIGIDAADLPHVFTPFFRTDRSRARKTGGVGLGLALVKRIVEAHRGTVSIESRAGAGTIVHFTIPVARTILDTP